MSSASVAVAAAAAAAVVVAVVEAAVAGSDSVVAVVVVGLAAVVVGLAAVVVGLAAVAEAFGEQPGVVAFETAHSGAVAVAIFVDLAPTAAVAGDSLEIQILFEEFASPASFGVVAAAEVSQG